MTDTALWDEQCKECPINKVREEAIGWNNEYHVVMMLAQLQRAGYPFEKKDLAIHTWLLMGTANEERDLAMRA